ncbi:hypothetical protein [Asaia astilbis]|uniref:hypothetical protein n=1 Tax=Asaia astilbis TaxID=610244 RepID=UPI0018DD6475|nr:hypothetical protein [Asaia astilbis]
MRSISPRSPYFAAQSSHNYLHALQRDVKAAQKIMWVIQAAERKINQELAKVNDTDAFDMIEIAGCFDYLKESTPTEQALEQRAGL